MSPRPGHAGQGGFTLVEMLLSVALLSLVLGLFGGVLFNLGKVGGAVSALERAEDVGVVRRYVAASLEDIRTMLRPLDDGRRVVHFAGRPHRVGFAGVASGDSEVGGLYETGIWLGDGGQLIMLRQPLGWGGGAPATPRVLLRGVASLAFTYSPCPSRTGAPGMQSWLAQDHLPHRITMTLTFAPGDSRTWPPLSVFPAASTCPFRG